MVNRYLAEDEIRPREVWENVKTQVIQTPYGFLVFDDTVIDKNYSRRIELARSQYSGNAHGIIKGIGVVTCVYVNPVIDQFWVIDYRIYDPDGDGKTKLDPRYAAQLYLAKVSQDQGSFDGYLVCHQEDNAPD